LGTLNGVSQFNKKEKLYERLNIVKKDKDTNELGLVTSMIPLSPESVLIGGSNGVFHFKQSVDGKFSQEKIGISGVGSNVINFAIRNSKGGVWLGTKSGLRLLDYDHERNILHYNSSSYFNRIENQITHDEVRCLYEDNSGLLWVGTKYEGLLKVDFKPKKFKCIQEGSSIYAEFKKNDIKSIYVDGEEKIWLGTAKKGLRVLELNNGNDYNFIVNKFLDLLSEDMVLSMYCDSKNRFWIGTTNGIFLYFLDKGTISEFSYAGSRKFQSLLKNNRINSIQEDTYGNIWFGTQFGLYKYNGYNISNYFADNITNGSICDDEVNALFVDSDGILWVGTSKGLNFWDKENNTFSGIGNSRIDRDSAFVLSNKFVLSIAEDRDKKLWIGTRCGVTYYNKKSNDFGFYTHIDGLANDMVNSVLCYGSNVWLSTNKGVTLIKSDGSIFNFDTSDGLPGYVFNRSAASKSNSGNLYFAGVSGIAYLQSDSINFNLKMPDVIISSVDLFQKGKIIKRFKDVGDHISLKYRKSSMLRVKYAALDFTEPIKNKFQIYLEGFDDDWRPITTSNEINISDLPVGEYTLHIKGSNSDSIWTDSPVNLEIKIISPIWMSNYAYAFYLIALIFFVQSIINYRIRNYKLAYKSLEEKTFDKKKIEAQKELLSKINQSLTDSIFYAKRIQESILPSETKIKQVLPESFIYYRPKDLVSGDFYWLHEMEGKVYIAAVDCTGHGVPGAFMSIVAYDMLKSIVGSDKERCPAKILDKLSKEVITTFKKNVGTNDHDALSVNDGMDIALCVIDKKGKKISFSGAYSPLYLVRDNEIFVYKGDRFPVGYQYDDTLQFSKHVISIEPDDVFYIFSDGYADQFGGVEGKKFKYRRFRHLLLNIHKLPADDQKAILHQKIEEWMEGYEQVDDMIIIGFRALED